MANSTAFEWICRELQDATSLDRLQARGTVRIALKQAGLDASSVTREQLSVLLTRVMPSELLRRGNEDADAICRQLASRVSEAPEDSQTSDSPEAVFARLGALE